MKKIRKIRILDLCNSLYAARGEQFEIEIAQIK